VQRCIGAWLAMLVNWEASMTEIWLHWVFFVVTNQFWLLSLTFNFVLHFVSFQPAQSVNFYGRWNGCDSHATLQRPYSLWVLNCEPNMKLHRTRVMFFNSKTINKKRRKRRK
jgi:hypothetical protein